MSGTGILWQSSGEDSASTAGGMGLIPDLGTKILHATHHGKKKKMLLLLRRFSRVQFCATP